MVQNYIYFSILQNKSSFIFRKGIRVEFFFVSLQSLSVSLLPDGSNAVEEKNIVINN